MWQWLYKLGSPRHFYEMTSTFLPWLTFVTYFLLIVGLVWGLGFAPRDYQMGDNYRIIYIHVPLALGALWVYVMMAVMAAMHMIWNIKVADMVAKSCAVVGVSYCAVALFTGAMWGKRIWGVYWIWDAKLTSFLILFFIYIGVMALRSAFDSETSASKAASVLTLVGIVNLPIVYYASVWWNTLHQPPSRLSLSAEGANPPEIWIPVFFTGFGLIGLVFLLVILRTRNEILWRERRAQWVQDLVKQELSRA
ncbi:MAG: heme ABC transporter permease CcmC [Pseudomonadales bacterium]|jgi:heme exporter protein C|nr:heme ABC transporter permease CcmC [Pseudomonadales bacterium]